MKIFITADPELPVPPTLYGGIERVVALLVNGLAARGHSVTLFAHPDSCVNARVVGLSGRSGATSMDIARNAAVLTWRAMWDRPDVVHSFGRLATLTPILGWRVAKLMSYQRAVTRTSIVRSTRLAGESLRFVGCSRQLAESAGTDGHWHVVYNGVPTDTYPYAPTVDDDAPLVFLGRIEHIKGAHLAIDVARAAGRMLIIAGNVPDGPTHEDYFRNAVLPYVDGDRVQYVGSVNDAQKGAILSRAAALLMPVLWDEPFGIVMAEALACGTPVIGLARGAVPEVVEEGVTGFVCRDAVEMVARVGQLDTVDRAACRAAAEQRFSQRALVDGYEGLYREMVQAPARRDQSPTGSRSVRRHVAQS